MQILVYDDTFDLIRNTMAMSMLMGLLLIVFIIVGAFTVLNMLIGEELGKYHRWSVHGAAYAYW
jgi:hypothetical protein